MTVKGLTRYRGDTYTILVTVVRAGLPYNLTNCTAVLSASGEKDPTVNTYIFQINGVIQSPTSGQITFTPEPEHVNRLGKIFFDVQITDAAGHKHTPIKSFIDFVQDITK